MFDGLGVLPDYDEPLDTDLLIRQSTIESMMLCPARVGYSIHPCFDPTPSEAMFFGSVTHAVLETHIKEDAPFRLQSPEHVLEIAHKLALDDDFDLDSVAKPSHLKAFADEIVLAYQLWIDQWWTWKGNGLKPLVVEERIVRPLGTLPNGRVVWVHGTPDVLHQPGMVDWKTAGRGWSVGKGEVRIQTPTYLWLGEKYRKVTEGLGTYVVYNRSAKDWSEFTIPVSQAQVDAALNTLWEYSRSIDAQVFPARPAASSGRPGRGWWCSPKFCSAWDCCEFKGLVADDTDLTQVRVGKWS